VTHTSRQLEIGASCLHNDEVPVVSGTKEAQKTQVMDESSSGCLSRGSACVKQMLSTREFVTKAFISSPRFAGEAAISSQGCFELPEHLIHDVSLPGLVVQRFQVRIQGGHPLEHGNMHWIEQQCDELSVFLSSDIQILKPGPETDPIGGISPLSYSLHREAQYNSPDFRFSRYLIDL
jgi:hypothetical protein